MEADELHCSLTQGYVAHSAHSINSRWFLQSAQGRSQHNYCYI